MKKLTYVFIILTTLSCTSDLERKLADKNGHEYFEKIANSLDSFKSYFEDEYKRVLWHSENGQKGQKQIILDYSTKYEDLTFARVLEKAEKEKKAVDERLVIEEKINNMTNEDAINYAFGLFQKGGYNGDINDFKELVKTNNEALIDAHKLFTQDGYIVDIDRFKHLLGLE
jgi:hypothetical protein